MKDKNLNEVLDSKFFKNIPLLYSIYKGVVMSIDLVSLSYAESKEWMITDDYG